MGNGDGGGEEKGGEGWVVVVVWGGGVGGVGGEGLTQPPETMVITKNFFPLVRFGIPQTSFEIGKVACWSSVDRAVGDREENQGVPTVLLVIAPCCRRDGSAAGNFHWHRRSMMD